MITNLQILAALCQEINTLNSEISDCSDRSTRLRLNESRSEKAQEVMEFIKHSLRNYIALPDFLIKYLLDALDADDQVGLGIKTYIDQSKQDGFIQLKIAFMREYLADNPVKRGYTGSTVELVSEHFEAEGISVSPGTIEKYYARHKKLIDLFKESGFKSVAVSEASQPKLQQMPPDYEIKVFLWELEESRRIRRLEEGENLANLLGADLKNFYKP